ncbi:MAG TPA: protease pro-enzyme activation domain-containing protein [Bryobacteraceae bacterium]|nr:protease pro-enzyme activation domain-containing protein [Bryobacteraceae bacterium]
MLLPRMVAITAAVGALLSMPLNAAGRQVLRGRHVPQAIASSEALGSVSRTAHLNLAVGLPLRNTEELDALLRALYDPRSPSFHRFLTPQQFAERFGPTEEQYAAVLEFMRSNGLRVTATHPNRMIVDVAGEVGDIERTLHVNMLRWRHTSRGEYFAPDREPSIDAAVPVLDVSGLDNFVVPRPMDVRSLPLTCKLPQTTGSGPAGLFLGRDFRAAYAPGVSLNGAGQAVGLFELDGFYASDVQANFSAAGMSPVPVQTVLLDGFNGSPGGANIEVTLDIMMAAYMAPGLSKIIVYEGYSPNDVLNRMATDNLASQLSSSWVFWPTNATTEQIFAQMIAQGQSLFQASGDSGAYGGWIMPPADDPSVTVVGGTSLTTVGAGGPWLAETTWAGSGGGVSTTWPIPNYQKSVNMPSLGGSAVMRNIPDVALLADVQIFLIQNNGQAVMVGGTSAAAPLWAGFMALVNQQAAANGKGPIGFLNPAIYAIGAGSSAGADLHDITTGSNGFSARPGYDLTTGWGTPAGQSLIDDLTGVSNTPGFTLSASPAALSVTAGASAATTITTNPQNGFSGSVDLSASGLPAGVTASFSPASAQSASTLTISASGSAATGTATVTISGVSGTLTSSIRLTLTVAGAPAFTLAAQPSALTVAPSASGTATVTATPQNGFNGTVTVTVSQLPAGVTASVTRTGALTSTVSLSVSGSAAPGNSTITITGVSGSLSSQTTLTLTVPAPASFSLTATPSSVSVLQGGTGTSVIAVAPKSGFSGSVAFAASGLPSGVTASFSPAASSRSTTVTFTASKAAMAGVSNVTITGSAGASIAQAVVALTVRGFTLSAAPTAMSIAAGSSGTTTIAVSRLGGFTGSIGFSASGLPTGVTASFNPATTTSASSVLTLKAAATAPQSSATVTITGASGTATGSTTVALTVTPAPSFTLSAAPSTLSIAAGASGTSVITATPQNGFNGKITGSVSGLPSGVTAAFSAGSSNQSLTLTLKAAATAPIATKTVTITCVSGSLSKTTTVALTITPPPSFTLSASPANLSVGQGASGSTSIAVNAVNGFTGTVALAASGVPAGVTATLTSGAPGSPGSLTVAVAATAAAGNSSITITGTSGSLTARTTVILTVLPAPTFTLTAVPASLTIPQGATGTTMVSPVPLYGFSDTVNLSVSNLPAGVTGGFIPGPLPGTYSLVLAADPASMPGPSTITVTGNSTNLTRTLPIALTVLAPAPGSTLVDLSAEYNVAGAVADGTTFSSGGLDGGGRAYSANLLGSAQTTGGITFSLGPPNAPSAVSNATVPLPPGQFARLFVLATAVNGNQANQVFTVNYSDGSTASFTQSLSDWCAPQGYRGEAKAVSMGWRDNSTGTRDTRTLLLYSYSLSLDSSKTVNSITLPATRNVVVLAMTLTTVPAPPPPVQVNLGPAFQTTGIISDGKTFRGGLDGIGWAYSGRMLGGTQTVAGIDFNIGAADAPDAVSGAGQAIALPAGSFSTLSLLGSAVNGNQTAQTFRVNYSDGTSATFKQSLSDWYTPQRYPGETTALSMPYRNASNGAKDNRPFELYLYSFTIDKTRSISSIVLPNNANVKLLAITLIP